MDNFKAIYKILLALERAMDLSEFDVAGLQMEGVSTERLHRYLEMLQDAGLIKNVDLYISVTGDLCLRNSRRIRITLKGLEYLQENAIMKKIYNAAKGIVDLVP